MKKRIPYRFKIKKASCFLRCYAQISVFLDARVGLFGFALLSAKAVAIA